MSDPILEQFSTKKKEYILLMKKVSFKMFGLVQETIQESISTVMNTSKQFIGEDGQDLKAQFDDLYEDDAHVKQMAEEVNADMDDLIDSLQNQLKNDEELVIEETEEDEKKRLGVSGLQKHVETLTRLDEGVKEKIEPLFKQLQCGDTLINTVNNLRKTFGFFSKFVAGKNLEEEYDFSKFFLSTARILSDEEEGEIFYRTIWDNGELKEVPQERCSLSLEVFILKYMEYYGALLQRNNEISEQATVHIGEMMEVLLAEAERIGNLSAKSVDSINKVKSFLIGSYEELIENSVPPELIEQRKKGQLGIFVKALKQLTTKDDDVGRFFTPTIESLQFQDRTKQNFMNLSAYLQSWTVGLIAKSGEEVLSVYDPEQDNFQPLGKLFFDQATMEEERVLLEPFFNTAEYVSEDNGDDQMDGDGVAFFF